MVYFFQLICNVVINNFMPHFYELLNNEIFILPDKVLTGKKLYNSKCSHTPLFYTAQNILITSVRSSIHIASTIGCENN